MTTICTECGKDIDDGSKYIHYVTCASCAEKERQRQAEKAKNKGDL